jgi:mannan endo-1,4-beta-mannosidase
MNLKKEESMKLNNLVSTLFVAATVLGTVACDDDIDLSNIPDVAAPVCTSVTPTNGNLAVKKGTITVKVKYDKRVFFSSADISKINVSGAELQSANVYGQDSVLTLTLKCMNPGQAISISVPEGVVTNTQGDGAAALNLNFSTKAVNIDASPVAATSAPAVKLYDYLRQNYGTKVLSGMMANVAWNTEESEQVYKWTGKYPAINGFDYIHLPASAAGENWINYNDITPVKDWADKNGIVTLTWHWLVPVSYDLYDDELWSGTQDMPEDWSGSIQIDKDKFANALVGDTIKVDFNNSILGTSQGSLKSGNWYPIADGTDYFSILTDEYTLVIDTDVLDSLKTSGLIVSGHDYTATKVRLCGKGIKSGLTVGNNDYSYELGDFNADRATVKDTWENYYFQKDLAQVAEYLKLLQAEGIPVLWRPFHEASGGWFWWGKNAESEKALWIAMFDYFKEQGLDNLIWVWVSEGDDDKWYPGDEYVDIIGRDMYTKTTSACFDAFNDSQYTYANKMVTLSECGTVDDIPTQYAAYAEWSWFMPWYGEAKKDTPHANRNWWRTTMAGSNVITREDLPSWK